MNNPKNNFLIMQDDGSDLIGVAVARDLTQNEANKLCNIYNKLSRHNYDPKTQRTTRVPKNKRITYFAWKND